MVWKPLVIEARINEYTPRSENGHIPFSAEEIGEAAARACEAGASTLSRTMGRELATVAQTQKFPGS